MIISVILISAGVFFLFFPVVDNEYYKFKQNNIIAEYDTVIAKAKEKSESNNATIDFDKLKRDIKAYNRKIYKEKQIGLKNKENYKVPALNLTDYGFKNNVYGYISIEKINVNMAIYLGASDYNMSLGAVHLSETSIPYGGKNSNSVIAGHCGYGGREMFRYIENLNVNDKIVITTPFKKIKYAVKSKKVVDPNDTQQIRIQENKDMLTLFTCYPYPTNKYRILIYCEREAI